MDMSSACFQNHETGPPVELIKTPSGQPPNAVFLANLIRLKLGNEATAYFMLLKLAEAGDKEARGELLSLNNDLAEKNNETAHSID